MDIEEYQESSRDSVYDPIEYADTLCYTALALCGKAGGYANVVKKGVQDPPSLAAAVEDLGDVLFYWVRSCEALGISPIVVMLANLNKLDKLKVERAGRRN